MDNETLVNHINNFTEDQEKEFNDICDMKIYVSSSNSQDFTVEEVSNYVNSLSNEFVTGEISLRLSRGRKLSGRPC